MKLPPTRIVLRSSPDGQPHAVALGGEAAAVLDKLCHRCKVKPEHVLQAIAESYLCALCSDETLIIIVEDARAIERTGQVPEGRWEAPGSVDR